MGSAASTLDNPMSIYPNSVPLRDHSRSPLGQVGSEGRGSIGLSGPLSKIDLSTRSNSGAAAGFGKGKAKALDGEGEKEEGEISDDGDDDEIQEIPAPYPPSRQSDVPPRGQPIDRSQSGRREGLRRRGDTSLSREREREWEEYRNRVVRERDRLSFDEDDRRASGPSGPSASGPRARRGSPSYRPYPPPMAQSAPPGYRPAYRPPPPSSIPLPYGTAGTPPPLAPYATARPPPAPYARPPPGPVRTPSGPIRPPPPPVRPPHPPTAPRALQPSPPTFRPNPSSVPVPRPSSTPSQPQPRPPQMAPPMVRPSPGHVAAAPANISSDEANQYKSILRNLLQDGVTPDQLVEHGATPQYVMAVCEEIVEGQKRRKSLWMGTGTNAPSSSTGRPVFPPPATTAATAPLVSVALPIAGPSSLPAPPAVVPPPPPTEPQLGDATRPIVVLDSSAPTSRAPSIRSPSPQVQVLRSVQMDRGASLSSEGSAERALIDSSPSPPRRLISSSHWAPPVRPNAAPPSRAIKIESYKPPLPAADPGASSSVSSAQPVASGSSASRPIVRKDPPSGPRSAVLYRRTSNVAQSTQSFEPSIDRPESSASANKRRRRLSSGSVDSHISSITAPAEDSSTSGFIEPLVPFFGPIKHPLPDKPFLDLSIDDPPMPPPHLNPMMDVHAPTFIPHPPIALPGQPQPPPVPSSTASQLASSTAFLEARRRALESMHAGRKKKVPNADGSASPMDMDIDVDTPTAVITLTNAGTSTGLKVDDILATADSLEAALAAEKSIEDEVADLEQEVMGFQSALAREEAEQAQAMSTAIHDANPPVLMEGSVATDAVQVEPTDNDVEMEADEPEEGELPPEDPLPTLAPTLLSVPLSPSSSRRSRRPGAEDLESRPTTAPSRTRRKPFGAPQRASKLILPLEDSDSDSEPDTPNEQLQRRAEILRRLAEEKQNSPLPFPLGTGTADVLKRSQKELDALAEHEKQIQALKAQIAARLKAKEALRLGKEAGASEAGSSRGDSAAPEDVLSGVRARGDTPLEQEVRSTLEQTEVEMGSEMEIKQEIVEVQTVVEAAVMEVETTSSTDSLGLSRPPFRTLPDAFLVPPSLPPATVPASAAPATTLDNMDPNAHDVHRAPTISPLDDRSPFTVPQAPPVVPFAPYSGILSRYPQLSSDAVTQSSTTHSTIDVHVKDDTANSPLVHRREILRGIILTRITHQDPDASLCSAEVGGGTCADASCQAIHFDVDLDPTSDDLVEYVLQSVPSLERPKVKRAVDLVLKLNPPSSSAPSKGTPKKGKGKGKARAGESALTANERLENLTLTLSKISHALGLAR